MADKGKPMISEKDFKLNESLSHIKHVIIVMSGKGGVGKSTLSVNLAMGLAMSGAQTGIMDIDIHGPNIPKMLHIEDEHIIGVEDGLMPVEVPPRLKVMSMAFLLPDKDSPVVWRGPVKMGAIRQFIEDVKWGDLDYLVVDLPPGTGDEPLSIVQLIPKADGAIIITTPQDVSLLDSRKTVTFARQAEIPVLGIVENMSGMVCPHCNQVVDVFKSGGGERTAADMGVDFLGRVPMEPEVVVSGDDGRPVVMSRPDSEAARAFMRIVDAVRKKVEKS
ncbi:MAG: Mrp/NBP35 family ATP-binding protein [Candidatus Methanomethylophilaceae archaeon]|nr:Mrp/NBP35 family ATP-binding protein [Candidatus Methanomethylophilaceae archaeon]